MAFAVNVSIRPEPEDGGLSISQAELVLAISREIDRQLGREVAVVPRQMNAIVDAANLICRELGIPERKTSAGMGLKAWLKSDDTGLSSEWLASYLGGFVQEFHYPHDPSDFGRCLRMLEAVPEFGEKLATLEAAPAPWPALWQEWDALKQLYHEELPSGKAPRLLARMQQIITESRLY